MLQKIRELFNYRMMIYCITYSEVRERYKGSFLGIIWALLNPLFMLVVYGFVFSVVLKVNIDNYFLFVLTGILPWYFFRSSILSCSNVILSNASLVKKIYFPREILPISTVFSHLVNYLLGLLVLLPCLIIFGNGISVHILYLPFIILIQMILTLGLAFFLSSATVYLRDIRQILDVIMMAMFYYTPILYDSNMIPDKYLFLFYLNPIKPIIEGYQQILFYNATPDLIPLFVVLVVAIVIFYVGWGCFNKLNKGFAEKI